MLGKGFDSGIGNDQAAHGDPQRCGKHRRYSRAWDRALACARMHRAMGTASPTIGLIGQGLAAASMSDCIAYAATSERCGIGQRRPLKNGGEEQGDGEQAAAHGAPLYRIRPRPKREPFRGSRDVHCGLLIGKGARYVIKSRELREHLRVNDPATNSNVRRAG